MMEFLDLNGIAELTGLALLAISLFYMGIAQGVFYLLALPSYKTIHEIQRENNYAVGFQFAGLYLAVLIGMAGAAIGPSSGFVTDVVEMIINGAVVTGFLIVAWLINDHVLLHGIKNREQAKNKNIAIGVIEFCSLLATGFIAFASFSGEGGGLLSAIVFFALGQAVLLAFAAFYEFVVAHSYSIREEIRNGNPAAALMLGGLLIALSIMLMGGIAGDFVSWQRDLAGFAYNTVKGIVLLSILSIVADKVFLPLATLRQEIVIDRNVGGVAVEVGIVIAAAVAIMATSI